MNRKVETSDKIIRRMQTSSGLLRNILRDIKRTHEPRKLESMTHNFELLLRALQADIKKLQQTLGVSDDVK